MEKPRATRRLTAIMSADVKDYSRLMRDDEEETVRVLNGYRQVMSTLIQQYYGRVVDSPGDNLLAEFNSVIDAVQSSVAIQKELKARNAELPDQRKMLFRIGINLGDVIVEEGRLYGDGVNIAARLEGLADPGGICISRTAYDQIEDKLPLGYEYMGEKRVKNFPKPVHAYRVILEPEEGFRKFREEEVFERKERIAGPLHFLVEKRRRRRSFSRKDWLGHLRAYFLTILALLVINLLTNPHELWFQWVAVLWGALLLIRLGRLRLFSKDGRWAGGEPAGTPLREGPSPRKPSTLIIQVVPKGAMRGNEEKVNIRIPFQALRAGVKLDAVLSPQVKERINETLKAHGVASDFFTMDRKKLAEVMNSAGDFRIEVERDDRTVRIFCE